jgi:GTPase SAR1 family protein
MASENSIYGKVTLVSRTNPLQFTVVSNGSKILCTYNQFCPLEVGDSVYIHQMKNTGTNAVELTGDPVVLIGMDPKTILDKMYLFCGKEYKSHVSKLYHALEYEAEANGSDLFTHLNLLAHRWTQGTQLQRSNMMSTRFGSYKEEMIDTFLKRWYKNRVLRQYYLFGINNKELDVIQTIYGIPLQDLFVEFLQNPYLLFTLSEKKVQSIAYRLGVHTDEGYKDYVRLHDMYMHFSQGKNGFKGKDPQLLTSKNVVNHKEYLYFKQIFQKEQKIGEQLKRLISLVPKSYDMRYLDEVQDELSEDKRDALKGLLSTSVGVLCGAAGTGKTTILRHLTNILEEKGYKIMLSSFTGKAVARIKQALRREDPCTLHLLLKETKSNPFDVLIIDEASMVSSELLFKVLQRFKHNYSLYLVGDHYQLSPIEWGRPFFHLIQSQKVPVYELSTCHRFLTADGEENGIIHNSMEIRNKKECSVMKGYSNFQIIHCSVKSVIKSMISNGIGCKDFTILSPFNKGLDELNAFASDAFIGGEEVKDLNGKAWRKGDRVMHLVNNYALDVMNGDEGLVKDFIHVNQQPIGIQVDFQGKVIEFMFTKEIQVSSEEEVEEVNEESVTTKNLTRSFAMTIHKSQGSEWNFVLLVIPFYSNFLTRNLFYTAVTRAKVAIWLITDDGVLNKIMRTNCELGNDTLSDWL